MNYHDLQYKYPSKRTLVYGTKGMVATSQPLAAQAGLDIIKKGGNAVDAAIATAACLTVVEPTSNGIGGDAFAIVWMKDKIYGLNSSGKSPESISIEKLKALGHEAIPKHGMIPVTVPGAPGAWAALSERFGNLTLKECLTPAIEYAKDGFPVSPITAKYWERACNSYQKAFKGEEFNSWFDTFTPKNRAPKPGEVWSSKGHANTLKQIGESNAKEFYQGSLADKIHDFSKQHNGFLEKSDLENHQPEWIEPVKLNYKGYDVWELPPNGQGIVALMALNILQHQTLESRDSESTVHRQIEAMKLAFEDGKKYITDPKFMKVSNEELLSYEYGRKRSEEITEEAILPKPGKPDSSGTVYLATADGEGNMVSFIQSNYMGFGSGVVIPGTGIGLQNRGHNFSLNPAHHNALAPGKRTFHTIIPGFISKEGKALGPFGVMGGFMQPQGHMQVINNLLDFNLNPQEALDAPRWQWMQGNTVEIEPGTPKFIFEHLQRRGHQVEWAKDSGSFGRGQVILINGKTLIGATEPRTDGMVAAW